MKALVSLLFTIIAVTPASAQQGWFIQPAVNAGMSQVHTGTSQYQDNTFSINGAAAVGYHKNHWRFSAGICYLTTGYQARTGYYIVPGDYLGIMHPLAHPQTYFHHIAMPLFAGSEIKLGRKVLLIPSLGIEASYNINEISKSDGMPTTTVSGSSFSRQYNRFSLWGMGGLHAECAVKNIAIFMGGTAHAMLTSLSKSNSELRNDAFLFDAGVTWFLHKKGNTFAAAKS